MPLITFISFRLRRHRFAVVAAILWLRAFRYYCHVTCRRHFRHYCCHALFSLRQPRQQHNAVTLILPLITDYIISLFSSLLYFFRLPLFISYCAAADAADILIFAAADIFADYFAIYFS